MTHRLSKLIAVAILAVGLASAAPLVIDNFQVAQPVLFVGPGGVNPLPVDAGVAGPVGDIIGGSRNLEVTRTNGSGVGLAALTGGDFGFGMFSDNGYSRIIWDGDPSAARAPRFMFALAPTSRARSTSPSTLPRRTTPPSQPLCPLWASRRPTRTSRSTSPL